MGYAPVALFVYNRPDHVQNNLYHLNTIQGVEETKLYIFSDAAKNEKTEEQVRHVRGLISTFRENDSKFESVEVIHAKENKGLAQSIIDGVSMLISQYGKVIVLEDDLLVADDFLTYMNGALDYYQDKQKIWAISGYSFPMKATSAYPHDVFMTVRGCSWGWATWADRWETVDWDVKDYSSMKFNIKNRIAFGKWGQDMPFMLDGNAYGKNHSWAIRWCYAAYKQDRYTVYPKRTRISNKGTDGSGTNYKKTITKYDVELEDVNDECKFEMLPLEENIRKEFRKKYMHPLAVIRASMRYTLMKI